MKLDIKLVQKSKSVRMDIWICGAKSEENACRVVTFPGRSFQASPGEPPERKGWQTSSLSHTGDSYVNRKQHYTGGRSSQGKAQK